MEEAGDYRSLCWFGRGLCESRSNPVVAPAGWSPRGVRSSPSGHAGEGGTSLGGRLWGPGIFRRPSAPATAQVQDSGGLAGAGLSDLLVLSSGVALLLRGGRVTWAGVLAVSVTASEEPCMSALCVQVLSRDPSHPGRPDRASHSEAPGPAGWARRCSTGSRWGSNSSQTAPHPRTTRTPLARAPSDTTKAIRPPQHHPVPIPHPTTFTT